jgi:hypothetical protein
MGGGSASAPSTPNYAGQARDIVNKVRQDQKQINNYFKNRTDKYLNMMADAQGRVDRAFGTTGADYVSSINKSYYGNMEDVSDKYKNMLTQEPTLLNTQAFGDFSNVLRQGSQEYGQAVTSASRLAGDRLYGTLGAPAAIAENLATSPSANNLIDQTFMDYAKQPPTVGNVMQEMSPYYTFNPDMTPYDIASFNVKKYKADTTPYDVKSYRIASINV